MRTFIFIFLSTFFLPSQRLVADDIVDIVARNGVEGKEPAPQTWTSAQITNALREIEVSWEKSPRECSKMVSRILRAKPDEPHALKILFTGVSKLPVPSAEENRATNWEKDPLFFKWVMLTALMDNSCLHDDPKTWQGMASMVGWVRPQIIPNYQQQMTYRQPPGLLLAQTEQERQDILREYTQKSAMDNCQRQMRDIVVRWSHSPLIRIRTLASKMPSDERKQFLDKIKALARSGTDEATYLDLPIELENCGRHPSVHFMRVILSTMPVEQRQSFINNLKEASAYNEEDLKALEAPYEEEN